MGVEVHVNKTTNGKKIKKISLDAIDENPINEGEKDIEYINSLALTIREEGLQNPLQVYEYTDGKYMLISGHKRLEACKINCANYDKDEEVECIVWDKPKDKNEETVKILLSNSMYQSEQDLMRAIEKAEKVWNSLPDKERAGEKRNYIARLVGKSPRTVSNYLKKINVRKEAESNDIKNVDVKNEDVRKGKKEKGDEQIIKKIKILAERLLQQSTIYKDLSMTIIDAINQYSKE